MSDISFENRKIDYEKLINATCDNEFMDEAFNLSNEMIHNLFMLMTISEKEPTTQFTLDRNTAIIYGTMIRAIKLFETFMYIECLKHDDVARTISRCIFETLVNLQYLIKKRSDELFSDFIKYSLKTEKIQYNSLLGEIAVRGTSQPIETRLLKNIANVFMMVGLNVDDPIAKDNKWEKTSLKSKCIEVSSELVYNHFVKSTNDFIHGNWLCLLGDHLEYDSVSERYAIQMNHTMPRSEHSLALMSFLCDAVICFIEYSVENESTVAYLRQIFSNSKEIAMKITMINERYCQRVSK